MGFMDNIGTKDGDNVGACIAGLMRDLIKLRDDFFKKHNTTMKEALKDKEKYQKLWEAWLKENQWL